MYTGYTITNLLLDGNRHMALNNDGRGTFKTREEAEKLLSDIIANNNKEKIESALGKNLEVTETTCYDSGESTRTVF